MRQHAQNILCQLRLIEIRSLILTAKQSKPILIIILRVCFRAIECKCLYEEIQDLEIDKESMHQRYCDWFQAILIKAPNQWLQLLCGLQLTSLHLPTIIDLIDWCHVMVRLYLAFFQTNSKLINTSSHGSEWLGTINKSLNHINRWRFTNSSTKAQ